MLRTKKLLAGAGIVAALLAAPAAQAQKVTYLFPAPSFLPAFGPIQVAVAKGYYRDAGIEFHAQVGKGGVDVAKQIGAGNALLGGILADGPIIVRPNGIPVKTIAVFGGGGFMQLTVREDSGITKPADLKGRTITTISYQDTTYYALLGVMASAGLTRNDVNIQAAGPTGVWKLVAAGKAQGMAGVPDWIAAVEGAGVKVRIMPSDDYFPTMGQAIGASDDGIANNKGLIRRFVKASLRGMKDMMDDPDAAALEFIKAVPRWKGKEAYVKSVFKYYVELIYPGQKVLGEINTDRLAKLQAFYLEKGLVKKKVPFEDLYTNEFVK